MLSQKFFFLVVLSLFFSAHAIGDVVVTIKDESEFSLFVSNVNSGTTYSGTTVLLGSDLSLSGVASPIGKSSKINFNGIFDGQGYIISNLKISTSSLYYVGLFGYSQGLTIRNVVFDSSCSLTSSYSGSSNVYTGGIIGYCESYNSLCSIENSVNMASVTFKGDIDSTYCLYLGGIAGNLYSYSDYPIYVKNCANYGSITHSGSVLYSSYIGGIVGSLSNSYYKYVYNCLNYGTITHSGETTYLLYLGGITGYSDYAYVEDCVGAGKILTLTTVMADFVGAIVGDVNSETYINYCYYTNELGKYDGYGSGTPTSSSYILSYDSTTFELSGSVSVGNYAGDSLIDALNAAADYYVLRGYSKWLLNKGNKVVKFIIKSGEVHSITMNSQIIIFPSLASEGDIMFEWYNDDKCSKPLKSFEITSAKTLYGKFKEDTNSYTITFDTRREGVSVAPITAQSGTVVQLPSESIKEYCSVGFWENEYGENVGLSLVMPGRNVTLYAMWKCTRIATTEDFTDFSAVVNKGVNYLGTTVYLDTDLSLPDKTFESINNFLGTFDGQGHVASNLKVGSSSSGCMGLFGHSEGLTIRNIVLDSSCSITSTYSSLSFTGGIIGSCEVENGECNIENSVNMAGVTFSGETSGLSFSFLGGIVGRILSSKSGYLACVKNCANYGSVTHSGTSTSSNVGGIAGYISGSGSYKFVQNCLNYGTITYKGASSSLLYIGGITGESSYAYIDNCVSAGRISIQKTPTKSYNGSIVGYINSDTYINFCYHTSDVGLKYLYSRGTPINEIGTPTYPSTVDSTLISNLNSHTSGGVWSTWILNANSAKISFKINNSTGFSLSSELVILPNLASNLHSFVGWFTDSSFSTQFSETSISAGTTLYGKWDKCIVTFDVNGGDRLATSFKYINYGSTYGELPKPTRTEAVFLGWFTGLTGGSEVTPSTTLASLSDHTLYAHWSVNNYTLFFDYRDGTVVDMVLPYGEFVDVLCLGNSTKKYYDFVNWCTRDGWLCLPQNVPAKNVTFFPFFTSEVGTTAGIIFGSFSAILVAALLVTFLVIIVFIIRKGMEVEAESVDIGISIANSFEHERYEKDNERIIEQMETLRMATGSQEKLVEFMGKNIDRKTVVNEVFYDLGIDSSYTPYGVLDSFKNSSIIPIISNGIREGKKLKTISKYLRLLFAEVRSKEKFEPFRRIYFGMKDVAAFMEGRPDVGSKKIIRFEGVVSGFLEKWKVIRLLSNGEEDEMPRGVLFKVENGLGYNIDGLGEVLFEFNSGFVIKRVREVIKERYVVVDLVFNSPRSDDEMVGIKMLG